MGRIRASSSAVADRIGAVLPSDIHAHAVLTGSSPSSGQVFKASPTDVQLHFNEPVRTVRATVSLRNGENQDLASWGAGGDVTIGGASESGIG
ncbi:MULTISPECIES: copper resistance protein CopC [Rhizobium]|uniref:copper resistance protein CopC n=1 Tax=Rhizobium TaxID=379 RepID=UPI001C927989|nr:MULTISPECIES: copper resistance protein CopC [Rhizobium]MBY3225405.1 copper resistance protein CopC [Rhizobium laguerreae]MBY3237800.1 copper resistance protein CopC [Rhizobium laguerreae]MDU0310722.1 copper resistance protein CopC [Rhizobium sp. 10PS4]